MEGSNPTFFIASIATLIGALTAAYVAWRKLRPETTSIQVTSADTLVTIATNTAKHVAQERDDLRARVDTLRDRLANFERRMDEAEDKAAAAEIKARNAESRADNAEIRVEVLVRANQKLKERIAHLEAEVERLKRGGNSDEDNSDEGNSGSSDETTLY